MKDIKDPFNFQFSLSNNVHQEPFYSYEKKPDSKAFSCLAKLSAVIFSVELKKDYCI